MRLKFRDLDSRIKVFAKREKSLVPLLLPRREGTTNKNVQPKWETLSAYTQ